LVPTCWPWSRIGLELQPSRLWVLRRSIFGLGAAQVLGTGLLITLVSRGLGLGLTTAIVVGLSLALSSTAFVLQLLAEKKELTTQYGRSSFAILLFQDLAVIPILAIIPILGEGPAGGEGDLIGILTPILAIGLLLVGGRLLLRPLFRLVATLGGHEIFTAASLLVVVAAAGLMEAVDLSMELGAFLAGVLLADSEFRHQLEAEIEPFKGLLLGLFFVAVGMTLNLPLLAEQPALIVGLAAGLIAIKWLALYGIGRAAGLPGGTARDMAVVLSQGGEFAFVIFATAVNEAKMAPELRELLTIVVTVSMVATPLLFVLNDRLLRSRDAGPASDRPYDTVETDDHRVVIAGMGRFGQMIARILHVRSIPFTALEGSAAQVDFMRRFGGRIYYGNARDLDLLRAARVGEARIFVVAVQDVDTSVCVADLVKKHFPGVKIFARARDRHHAHRLMDVGVDYLIREAFPASLETAEQVLLALGDSPERARRTITKFRENDERLLLAEKALLHDEHERMQTIHAARRELEDLFAADERAARHAARKEA
jgi:glutathione-regulated potassium-efflux system ancillary protein KefC/glutathione-regulated potassium-efflux system protein KefB